MAKKGSPEAKRYGKQITFLIDYYRWVYKGYPKELKEVNPKLSDLEYDSIAFWSTYHPRQDAGDIIDILSYYIAIN